MWELLALGAVAASAVFLGFPLAQTGKLSPRARAALTGGTIGILGYLILDLGTAAWDQLGGNFVTWRSGETLSLLLVGSGIASGTLALRLWRMWQVRPRVSPATGRPRVSPPFARPVPDRSAVAALQLSTITAAGIGIHNLAEGLALGTTYVSGATTLTVLLAGALIVHKSTEGYCICGCNADIARRFTRTRLATLGLVAGGPTFVGTLAGGYLGAMPVVSLFVYGLAIGAISGVVGLILEGSRRSQPKFQLTAFAAVGFGLAYLIGVAVASLGG